MKMRMMIWATFGAICGFLFGSFETYSISDVALAVFVGSLSGGAVGVLVNRVLDRTVK